MATFNPKVETFNPGIPERDPPNFLGYSQGIGTNKVMATLFEGVGNIVEGAAVGADNVVQEGIKRDARAGVDAVRTLFGADDATTDASQSEMSAGKDVLAGAKDYLGRLQSAYETGSIRESHYYGQLNAVVKSLRAKYPGYDEQIDSAVSGISGVNPANAVVSALRQEAQADATKSSSEENFIRQFEKDRAAEIITWMPTYFDLPENERPSPQEMIAGANRVFATNEGVKSQISELTLKDKNNELTHEDLVLGARDVAATVSNQVMNGGLNSIKKIDDVLKNWKDTGTAPTPEQAGEIQSAASSLKTQMATSVINALGESWYDLYKTEGDDILQSATAQVDVLIDAVNNQDYGVVHATTNYIKASQETEVRHILEKHGVAARLGAARQILGEAGASLLLSDTTEGRTNLSLLSQELALGAYAGRGDENDDGINQTMRDLSKENVDAPTYTRLLDANIEDIINTSTQPETSKKAIEWLFNNDGGLDLGMFDQKFQTATFAKLASPAVTARVQELTKDNPEGWKQYSGWVYRNFQSQYQKLAVDVGSIPKSSLGLFDFYFDAEAGQIGMTEKPGARDQMVAEGSKLMGGLDVEALATDTANKFRELNTALSVVKPVLEADEETIGEAMKTLLPQLQLPITEFNNPEDDDEGGTETEQKQGNLLIGGVDLASYDAGSTSDLIKGFEGFISNARWDVNAFRAGYGSDTVTRADGTVEKVTKDTTVSKEDADRDLSRRLTEFEGVAKRQVGEENWDSLPANIKAAVISITYNYGEVPKRIRSALVDGDPDKIAAAISSLKDDNSGVNKNRRGKEADFALNGRIAEFITPNI